MCAPRKQGQRAKAHTGRRRHALELGDYLRAQGITVDAVLCSSAARVRQTLELLKLDDQVPQDRVDIADRFYNVGAPIP
jgi:phosphohistidine phosphatase SixA